MTTTVETHPTRWCPVCGRLVRREFPPGPGGRPHAVCPRCKSLERHRFFALLLGALAPRLRDLDLLLDVSPTPHITPLLERLAPRRYLRLDVDTPRGVDVRASLTALPLRDSSVDLLVCYHVLEHVPDDRTAMAEIARVLAGDGIGLLQVPWRPGPTEEGPDAPPEERRRRFGLADHVRQYGDDFDDRLVAAGLSVERLTPQTYVGPEMTTWTELGRQQNVWVVRRSSRPSAPAIPQGDTPLTQALDAALTQLAATQLELRRARSRVRELRKANRSLREGATPGPSLAARARRRLGHAVRRP